MRTVAMRSALDAGRYEDAVAALNKELGVPSGAHVPKKLVNDDALLVLDRAAIHQSLARYADSKRDYEAADKAIDILDLSKGTADDIAKWIYSDSAGRYVAPPHEKILVNTFNMVNYLETKDLEGAKVEARRMSVAARFLRDRDNADDKTLALGSLIAGFAYEKSGHEEEARRYYADAVRVDASLLGELVAKPAEVPEGHGEILVVVSDGRVSHRVANHVPIGLALTRAAPFLSPDDHVQANKLAAQGLVTWVNFPTLAPPRSRGPSPSVVVDGRPIDLALALDCEAIVRSEWTKIEGEVMAAAVMRAVARVVAGKAIEGASSTSDNKKVKAVGTILSLVVQAALTVADVPDTRSWETIPARVSIARLVVPAGEHVIALDAGGLRREGRTRVTPGGFAVASVMSLR